MWTHGLWPSPLLLLGWERTLTHLVLPRKDTDWKISIFQLYNWLRFSAGLIPMWFWLPMWILDNWTPVVRTEFPGRLVTPSGHIASDGNDRKHTILRRLQPSFLPWTGIDEKLGRGEPLNHQSRCCWCNPDPHRGPRRTPELAKTCRLRTRSARPLWITIC